MGGSLEEGDQDRRGDFRAMTEDQLVLLRDKYVLWDWASRDGPMDARDYNRRAADALKQLLSEQVEYGFAPTQPKAGGEVEAVALNWTRQWLARQLLDTRLDDDEAFGIVAFFPTVNDIIDAQPDRPHRSPRRRGEADKGDVPDVICPTWGFASDSR